MPEPGLTPDQLARLQQISARVNATRSYIGSASPYTAANLTGIARQYPGISPGVAYAFAASGQGPGPVVESAWQKELAAKAGRPRPGQKRKARITRKEADRKIEDLMSGGFSEMLPDPVRAGVQAVAGAAGDVVHGRNPLTGDQVGATSSSYGEGVKGAVKATTRYAVAGLGAPLETGMGYLREAVGGVRDLAQGEVKFGDPTISGGQSAARAGEQSLLGQMLQGRSAGSGWLPSYHSEAGRAQAEAARRYSPYLVGGHAWTPGRALADTVFEPDDDAFNILSGAVDAGIALSRLDPAGTTLGALADARAAGKMFANVNEVTEARKAAGAWEGMRKFLTAPLPDEWRASGQGQRLLEAVSRESDAWTIHQATKIPYWTADNVPLVENLAKAKSPDAVWDVLKPYLGTEIRTQPGYGKVRPGPRLLETVPGRTINFDDPNRAALTIDRYLANAKVPLAQRKAIAGRMARADTAASRYGVFDTTMDAVRDSLVHHGVDAQVADEWTTVFKNNWKDGTNYSDAILTETERIASPFLSVDGAGIPVSSPFWDTEMLHSNIPLPDFRQIRRGVSSMSPVINNKAFGAGVAALDAAMGPWRRLMLARPAWGVRVVAEEQLRIAAYGMNSLYKNPLGAVAMILGNPESRVTSMLDNVGAGGMVRKLKNAAGDLETDIAGVPFYAADDYTDALYKPFTGVKDSDTIYLKQFEVVNRGDALYGRAVGEELARLMESRVGTGVLRQESPQAAKAWFWEGKGKALRLDLADNPKFAGMASDQRLADEYIDEAYLRIKTVTNNQPELLDAIRTGKINGHDLIDAGDQHSLTKHGLEEIEALVAQGLGPDKARVRKFLTFSDDAKKTGLKTANNVLGYFFDALAPRPSSYLSRSPFFRQTYWKRAEELIPYMDYESRVALLKTMDTANLGKQGERIVGIHDRLYKMEKAGGVVDTPLNLEHVDLIAKKFALGETKNLLYDLSERSQLFDALRLVFPFGEAWKEIVTRWAKLAWERPQVFRRGTQAIMGARSSGFFHQDQFGQEVFTYPGSEWLTKQITGVPIPLKGSVQGLNLVGQGLPGVGPAVSIPVSYLLPDKPEWDGVSKMLFPYGNPNSGNPFTDVPKAFLPSWAQKISTAFSDPNSTRMYGNTVFDVARYLHSTGDYNLNGPNAQDEVNRLLSDAKKKAKLAYIVRGIGQANLPTSPSPEWQVEDKSGNLVLAWKLSEWYQKKLKETGDPQEALEAFLDKFGYDNFLVPQAKSVLVKPGAPDSKAGVDWARKHADIARDYQNVYGYFAPDDGGFDSAAYERQLKTGEREALTPAEMIEYANGRIASQLYNKARADMGATISAREATGLREYKRELLDEFPGYGAPRKERVSIDTQIRELTAAAKDKRLARTDTAKAIKQYLKLRQQAIERAEAAGLPAGPWTAERAQPLRDWLLDQGERIADQHPDFRKSWDLVFSREVE